MLASLVEDLDAVGRRHVQTALSIEATALPAGALPLCEPRPVEIRELALIRELTIRTDVEHRERAGVRDDDVLLVRREDHAVGAEPRGPVFGVLFRDLALRRGVIDAGHREVDSGVARRRRIIEDAADAVQRIAVGPLVCDDPLLRRDFLDRRVAARGSRKTAPSRRASGSRLDCTSSTDNRVPPRMRAQERDLTTRLFGAVDGTAAASVSY
jgi:hypothetical protein